MSLDAGIKLGRYEIRSKIGEGGMGEVYHARDTQLGRDVAIKVLPSTYSQDRERLHRFEQEACAASALATGTQLGRVRDPLEDWTADLKR